MNNLLKTVGSWIQAHMANSWMANPDFDAAMAHIGWAGYITLIFAYLFGNIAFGISVALFVAYALIKEYCYDARFESPVQTTRMNTIDVLTYAG